MDALCNIKQLRLTRRCIYTAMDKIMYPQAGTGSKLESLTASHRDHSSGVEVPGALDEAAFDPPSPVSSAESRKRQLVVS